MSVAPRNGQIVGGKYRLVRSLGQGGMGVVYEAQNVTTGKRVALKWLHPHLMTDPELTERFRREARVSSRVRHANVVDLYDVCSDEDALFLVMEYLEGESLADYLARGPKPIHELVSLLSSAMRGLSAAHKQGIVHRDLKPENIFLAREGEDSALVPKLLDFGISKLVSPESGQVKLTRAGSTFGTPMYMSYEQLFGRDDVDARADVYSFGVILYQALTGKLPYPAESFAQLVVQFSTHEPIPPHQHRPDVPEALDALILQTLSHDRERRPQTIDALIAAIKPFTVVETPAVFQRVFTAEFVPPPGLIEAPKPKPVAPRRERAIDFEPSDPPDVVAPVKERSLLRSVVLPSAGVLLALTLWLLKPADGDAVAAPSEAPRALKLETIALPFTKRAEPIVPDKESLAANEPAAQTPQALPAASNTDWSSTASAPKLVTRTAAIGPKFTPPPTKPRVAIATTPAVRDAGANSPAAKVGPRVRVPIPRDDQF